MKINTDLERFRSLDQRPYWFTETKDHVCIRKSSIPGGLVGYTNMAALDYQYGCLDVIAKRSIALNFAPYFN